MLLERGVGPGVAEGDDGTLGGDETENAAFEGTADLGPVTQARASQTRLRGRSSHAEAFFGVVLEVLEAELFPSVVLVELEQNVAMSISMVFCSRMRVPEPRRGA